VDEPEIVAVLEADDLLAPTGGIDTVEARCALHGDIELKAGCVLAADHLAALEHMRRRNVGPAHLPDEGIVLAIGDGFALARPGRKPDNGAFAGLAVDLGEHHVGLPLRERPLT